MAAFSFTLPLPKIKPDHRTFFAKADDSPSFRGGRPKRFGVKGWQCASAKMPEFWSTVCDDQDEMECWDDINQANYPASLHLTDQWNGRRGRNLFPPWLPLGLKYDNHQIEIDKTEKGAVNIHSIKRTLCQFLQFSRYNIWSQRLICHQMVYGWDTSIIKEELRKLLPKVEEPVQYSDKAKRPIARLDVIIIATAPLIIIRLFANSWVSKVCKYFEYSIPVCICSLLFCFLWLVASPLLLAAEFIDIRVAFLVPLPAILHVVMPWLCYRREGILDTIGMAWPLKDWVPTGLPCSTSRQEVEKHLQKCNKGAFHGNQLYLQTRPQGWFVLVGTREGDWLESNKTILQKAIKDGTFGPLDGAGEQLDTYHDDFEEWQGDDGVGIAKPL